MGKAQHSTMLSETNWLRQQRKKKRSQLVLCFRENEWRMHSLDLLQQHRLLTEANCELVSMDGYATMSMAQAQT